MTVILTAGLGFGDEGKGSIVDFLTRKATLPVTVVRYSGGPQAAHNVVLPDGRHHTFAQFGSGTLAGARTHISKYMLIDPLTLDKEARALRKFGFEPYDRLTIDKRAVVITPFHVMANRAREEARGHERHGSCGMGVGEAMSDSLDFPQFTITAENLTNPRDLMELLLLQRDHKMKQLPQLKSKDWFALLSNMMELVSVYCDEIGPRLNLVDDEEHLPPLLQSYPVIFEGAQGVLLDQDYGFHPYTTWTDTTFGNAFKLLNGFDDVRTIGIFRGYCTRHGPGPMPTEILTPTCDIQTDTHNTFGEYQRAFRIGHFDLPLAQYALDVIGHVDELYVTNLDKLSKLTKVCPSYQMEYPFTGLEMPTKKPLNTELTDYLTAARPTYIEMPREAVPNYISEALKVPVTLQSYGPTHEDKKPWNF